MKRTKENWVVGHPEDRNGISGLRFFDGEDLHYQDRKREFQKTQQQWIQQQKREKELQKKREAEEERMYAYQTMQANRMRGMLEDELNRKMRMMQASTRDANIQLSQQKKDRERREREQKIRDDDDDLVDHDRIRQVPQYMNPLH